MTGSGTCASIRALTSEAGCSVPMAFMCPFSTCLHLFVVFVCCGASSRGTRYGNTTLDVIVVTDTDDGREAAGRTLFGGRDCPNGHLQGYGGRCANGAGCLRRLAGPSSTLHRRVAPADDAVRWRVHVMPGSLDAVHIRLVGQLASAQWASGVYGAVVEVGVSDGKLTVVLASNIDTASGERLLVSDSSSSAATESLTQTTHLETIRTYLADAGLLRHLYMHHGTSLALQHLQQGDLPQIRFAAIGSNSDWRVVLRRLESCVCMLRDGAIVTIDVNEASLVAVRHFFHLHGGAAISPLIELRDKLYMCTTNWRERYTRAITTDLDLLLAYDFRQVTTSALGIPFTFLTADS